MRIRPENAASEAERQAVRAVHTAALGTPAEAGLVDALRDGFALVALVAEDHSAMAGHVLFSRMEIHTPARRIPAVALAPVAVRPEYQRQGIGQRLIHAGLAQLRQQGKRIVIVVGHPGYHPRFGFSAALAAQLQSPFSPEAFMALELVPEALAGVYGSVVYPPQFGL